MVKHSRRRSTRRRHGGLSRKDEDNFLQSKAKERRDDLAKVGERSRGSPKVLESVGTEQRKPKTWYSADTMAARAAASGGRTRRHRRHRR
jgi:hypothetical protein